MKNKLLGLYLFFEQIKSPLLNPGQAQNLTAIDLFRGLYAVKHPIAECLGLWSEGAAVYDAAVIGWAGTIEPEDLPGLVEAMIGELGPQIVRTQSVLEPLQALRQQAKANEPGAADQQQPGADARVAGREVPNQPPPASRHNHQQTKSE